MKLIKITDDHYVVVDETIQPVNGYYYDSFINKIKSTNGAEYGEASHCWQITHSTQPVDNVNGFPAFIVGGVQEISLQEVKELIGEVDVEKKANEEYKDNLHNPFFTAAPMGYIKGYNQALEDKKEKKYTEKEVVDFLKWLKHLDNGTYHYNPHTKEKSLSIGFSPYDCFIDDVMPENELFDYYIQSLQPKTEWEVEWETIDNRQPCHCQCHNNIDMIHFVACCNDGWIGKITQKLKLI